MGSSTLDQSAIAGVVARLTEEFAGIFRPETVERYVADCLTRPLFKGEGGVAPYVPALVERFARDRLRAVAQLEGVLPCDRLGLLFVCVRNAGRSQMAAALLDRAGAGRIRVRSAGSTPAAEIHDDVRAVMDEEGIDLTREFPKPLTEEAVVAADVVVTMGCGDACPIYPGKRYEDWELDDPAGKPLEEVRAIRDDIARRTSALAKELLAGAPEDFPAP